MDKVYKVVRAVSTGMVSAIVRWESHYRLRYFIGRVTFPKVGGIFAFDALEAAVGFCFDYAMDGIVHILECEAEINPEWTALGLRAVLSGSSQIEHFWENIADPSIRASTVPQGTVVCNWVKPIRDVTQEETEKLAATLEDEKMNKGCWRPK